MNLWVYRNWSRHATCHQRSYWSRIILWYDRIKARKSKSTEQYDCKLFFRLNWQMFKSITSAGRDFDSTIKFNVSTGEEHCEWFACGTEFAFDIKQVTVTSHLPLFSPETRKMQSAVYSEWKHLCVKLKKTAPTGGLDRYLGTWLHSRIGKNYSLDRAAPNTWKSHVFLERASLK